MKNYLLIAAMLLATSCNANTTEETKSAKAETPAVTTSGTDTLANAVFEEAAKEKETIPAPDTSCYVLVEGDDQKNINAVRTIRTGNKITGVLKYIAFGEKPAVGELNGTIKDGIITADWTFIRDTNYYKVPVSFKVTKTALLQKPTVVNDEGQPYIPEGGEYTFEFKKVNCEYFPE